MHFQWHTALCHSPVSSKFDYFPCSLRHLFGAALEFAVIFKLLYSGTDKDCVFYFCISDPGNWLCLVDVKNPHSDLHKIHHSGLDVIWR